MQHIPTVAVGYVFHKNSQTAEKERNKPVDIKKDIIKIIDTKFLNEVVNVNVLGCGIIPSNRRFIITKGTQVIWESPLVEMFAMADDLKDSVYLDLVPYVSVENAEVNVGQKCFVYELANMNRCKQKLLNIVLDSFDKEESH